MAKALSRELAALCTLLSQWRHDGGGGRGKPVPESLWLQAATIARVDGVDATARATRLNRTRLRARMDEADRVLPSVASASCPPPQRVGAAQTTALTQFVSLQMPAKGNHAISIELYASGGERMRIESVSAVDLGSVVQAFWRRQS